MSDSSKQYPDPALAADFLSKFSSPVVISNAQQQTLWCNQAFSSLVPKALEETQQPVEELIASTLSTTEQDNILQCQDTQNETPRYFERQLLSLQSEQGEFSAHVLTEVTHRVLAQNQFMALSKKIEELTTIEPVSGLLNYRAMLQSLEPLVSRSRRYENPLSMVAIELLNFSLILERHGKNTADKAVIALSHLLKDQLRWADIISRVADTRIVIILPETEQVDALYLANKILGQISELEILNDNNTRLELDTCYGVAAWQKGNDSMLLMKRTYQALDKAIQNGSQSIVEA